MEGKIFIRILTILCLTFAGLIIGILLGPSLQDIGIEAILSIGILLLITVIYSTVRIYLIKQRKILTASRGGEEKSEIGFMVETFQELIGRLKEKEKELDRQRASAEERAVSMEVYSENILQSVPSGVVSIDNSMKIKSVNQAAERILGINAREVIDRDFPEVFNEPLITLIRDKKTISRGEYPYVTKDNRHIWLGVSTSPLRNAAGETIGLIFVFTDLTDVKTLQEQVKLKERLTQLGEMSAGISHELRNSMSVISGYAKFLSKKVESSQKAAVDAILEEIKNMDLIISELLQFTKPAVLNTSDIDLNRLINETVTATVGSNETIRVTIDTENSIFIRADEVLLRQALTNILNNAIEAMPEGGNLEIKSRHLKDRVIISIKDTGEGIPENIKEKIFLPFYTTKQKGIGLGLALVQKIILAHNGSIEVDSTKGQGTIFTITLPAGLGSSKSLWGKS